MFVYSVKSNHIKFALLLFFIGMTVISLSILSNESTETGGKNEITFIGETNEDRMTFISHYGWKVNEEPIEVREIIIPTEFDDTYKAYNDIQNSQGFDLNKFAGKRVKRWTYVVKNYNGYENQDCIHANVLVYDGKVIGGDVCSVRLDGFMHGFDKPN